MLRFLITSLTVAISLCAYAQANLVMGDQFGDKNIDQITEWVQQSFTLTPAMGENPKEKVPCYKTKNKEVRFYALNTLTIKAPADIEMTSIIFPLSKQGIEEQSVIMPSTGKVEGQSIGSNNIVWKGKASEVTFVVGETNSLHPEEIEDGSGQFDFTEIVIYTTDNSAGVVEVSMSNSDKNQIEYYDLNGRRVVNPVHGLYLCKNGNFTSKIYLK